MQLQPQELARLRTNRDSVLERIERACKLSGRAGDSVRLVAVTKQVPVAWAAGLLELGHRDLGENYPQELWSKVEELGSSQPRWHLIGHLQTNKAKKTYPLVSFVHAVDSLKLLRRLDELAAAGSTPAPVCLQVNCSDEEAKHGWGPDQILDAADDIASCRHVPVVGLMTMAALGTTAEEARPAFARLRLVREALSVRTGRPLPELSMGMSNDFEAAIAEGATWVRVGSALFEGLER